MPAAPKRPCSHPGCGTLTSDGRCPTHWKRQPKSTNPKYSSTDWKQTRKRIRARDPMCRMCRKRPTRFIDHIVSVHNGGSDADWNLQGLCNTCHNSVKASIESAASVPRGLKPSLVPLTIVCGPPGSGKTTYVAERAGQRDLVLDLDVIKSDLSGLPLYQATDPKWVKAALQRRNFLLDTLSRPSSYAAAWLIVGSPLLGDRRQWCSMLKPTQVIMLETSPDVCIARIRADERRQGLEDEHIGWLQQWWSRYTRGGDETVIDGFGPRIVP